VAERKLKTTPVRYQLVTIGSLKRPFYREACQFYLDRLKPYAKFELVELKEAKSDSPVQIQLLESQALVKAADGLLVGLDERGKLFSSSELAAWVSGLESRGVSKLSLLVGGAEGHCDELRSQADQLWSLSPLTLPHDLARLVLLEQVYRIETIRHGHPYHRA
jgi:23S rRNA (pseudouridine1915-N3)-methyltransferase